MPSNQQKETEAWKSPEGRNIMAFLAAHANGGHKQHNEMCIKCSIVIFIVCYKKVRSIRAMHCCCMLAEQFNKLSLNDIFSAHASANIEVGNRIPEELNIVLRCLRLSFHDHSKTNTSATIVGM